MGKPRKPDRRKDKKKSKGKPSIPRAKAPQQAGTYEDPMQTALAYRMSRYGLTEAQARDQHAATELGRLWLCGSITEAMREAGERYLDLHEDMLRAIKAPVGLRKTNSGGEGGDLVTGDYVEWAIGAVAKWKAFELRGWPCLQAVVIDDQPVGSMLAELRVALQILAKRFGMVAYAAAAS